MPRKRKVKNSIRLNKILFILLIIILICIFVGTYLFVKSKKSNIEVKNYEVKLDEELYNTDCIKESKNIELVNKKEKLDTSKTGKYDVKLVVKDYFGREKDITCTYVVKDDIAPEISANDKIETTVGTKIDLLKDVKVTDNYDKKVDIKVSGDYSFEKEGEYKLKYIAKDSSGNESEKDFVLVVKKKQVTTASNSSSKTTTSTKKTIYFKTSKGFNGYVKNGVTYIDGYLIANKSYPLPSTYGNGLTSEFNSNFKKMKEGAKKDGITLTVVSGFRSYSTQKAVYNKWVSRDGKAKADTYSARPGYSEHQSGLAADLNHVGSSFDNTKEAKWLAENCYKYGFILRYPQGKQSETGYIYESWHFRYVGKDLAKKLYNNGNWITMESYFGITSDYNYKENYR